VYNMQCMIMCCIVWRAVITLQGHALGTLHALQPQSATPPAFVRVSTVIGHEEGRCLSVELFMR
jgi:hypothetical protein